MSYLGTVDFPASSGGAPYKFHAYTDDHVFDDVGAVYIFTKKEENTYYRLYIGQTRELGERIRNHEKWSCVRRYNVNSICVLFDESLNSRRKIETNLLGFVEKPPCND